jgi:hypothetical protein
VERERHQRIEAGIPDAADVDLSLIRLPAASLIFPTMPDSGKDFDVTAPRNPRNFSKEFARRANVIGFGRTRFHDLRGIHATALLDAGIPVHTVAQPDRRRCGRVVAELCQAQADENGRCIVVERYRSVGGEIPRVLTGLWGQRWGQSQFCSQLFLIFEQLSD